MSIAPFGPKQGDTHFDTQTGELRIFDGQCWLIASPGMQGLSGPSGIQGPTGVYSPYIPTITVGPSGPTGPVGPVGVAGIPTKKPSPEWEPFFAIWPRRTISGKLRAGPIMKRTQKYEEYTDFSSVERITITRYATKKEAFVWKMKYHG